MASIRDTREIVGFMAILAFLLICTLIGSESHPLKSRNPDWLSSSEEESKSYNHFGGDGSVRTYIPQHQNWSPKPAFTGSRKSNTTLAAIVLFAVLAIGTTVFLVFVCSKMSKKESYNPVAGTVN